jgi:hypothetical protein
MRLGLLPAAGNATRMGGLPKFLLPVSEDHQCILSYHVEMMAPFVDRIIIPTRSEWVGLLRSFSFGPDVDILEMRTSTMAETVKRSLDERVYASCVLGMPDTYFVGGNPYRDLTQQPPADVSLIVFPTRPEQVGKVGSVELRDDGIVYDHADKEPERDFGVHWGVMEFTPGVEQFLSSDATTGGYLIAEALARDLVVRGHLVGYPYFDCGTFHEYLQCLTLVNLPD